MFYTTAVPTVTANFEKIASIKTFAAPTIPRPVRVLVVYSPWMWFCMAVFLVNGKGGWIRRRERKDVYELLRGRNEENVGDEGERGTI